MNRHFLGISSIGLALCMMIATWAILIVPRSVWAESPGGAKQTTYTVQPGDTLSYIAKRFYNRATKWPVIYRANQALMKDAAVVEVGWTLIIPPLDTVPVLPQVEPTSITFVTGNEYPPFAGETLPQEGMLTEVVRTAFNAIGYDVNIEFWGWKYGLSATKEGKFTGVFPHVKNQERQADFYYSQPLYRVLTRAFVRQENAFTFNTLNDLQGLTVCRFEGASTHTLEPLVEKQLLVLRTPATLETCFNLLVREKVDVVVVEELVGRAVLDAVGLVDEVRMLNKAIAIETLHLLLPKYTPEGRTLLYEFDQALAHLKATGDFDRMVSRHLKQYDAVLAAAPQSPQDLFEESSLLFTRVATVFYEQKARKPFQLPRLIKELDAIRSHLTALEQTSLTPDEQEKLQILARQEKRLRAAMYGFVAAREADPAADYSPEMSAEIERIIDTAVSQAAAAIASPDNATPNASALQQPGEPLTRARRERAPKEIELISAPVTERPTIDGRADERVWETLPAVTTLDFASQRPITLKSVHTEDEIFFLVTYPDQAPSETHKSWEWDSQEKIYKQILDREDVFVFKWSMVGNEVNLGFQNADPHQADIWYWKARRTNPSGFADDKWQTLSYENHKDAKPVQSSRHGELYLRRVGDAGQSAYAEQLPDDYQGDVLSRYLPRQPQGSRADIRAKGHWQDGAWSIEFSRRLYTGHADDIVLIPGGNYLFAVSRYEMAAGAELEASNQPLYKMGDAFDRLILRVVNKES